MQSASNWGEGGIYRVSLHTIAGALGDAVSGFATPVLNNTLYGSIDNDGLAHLLAGLAAGQSLMGNLAWLGMIHILLIILWTLIP